MDFRPTTQELHQRILDLPGGRPNTSAHTAQGYLTIYNDPSPNDTKLSNTNPLFKAPGSEWTNVHLTALHVVPLLELPVSRIVPEAYIPQNRDLEFQDISQGVHDIRQATSQDLCNSDTNFRTFRGNVFWHLFNELRELAAWSLSEVEGNANSALPRRRTAGLQIAKETSEAKSAAVVHALVEALLSSMQAPQTDLLLCTHRKLRATFQIGGRSDWTSVNDGYMYVGKATSHPKFVVHSKFPLVTFEAKDRGAYAWDHFVAQQFSGMLGAVQASLTTVARTVDREAFCLGMRHGLLTISTVYMSASYIDLIMTTTGSVPSAAVVYFRQTKPYNLFVPEERLEAARGVMALIRYLTSGNARV